jgi:Ca2+-binding EF-hand superfamily protein
MKTTLALLLTLSLCSLAPAQAPPAAPAAGRGGAAQIEAALKAADANSDGKITKEEAGGAPWFDRLDQNQDGVLDAAELERVRKGMAAGGGGKPAPGTGPQAGQFEAMMKNLDKNSDGKITKEEAGGVPWFDRLDRNQDGVIDAAELETVRKAMAAGGGAKPAAGKPAPGAGQFDAMVKNLDKNSDGKITKEEAGGAPWFDRMDQNKDGVVDAAELETVRKAMAAGAGAKPATGKPAPGAGQFDAMVKNLDRNADGKVTKEEAGGAAWFDRLDQNQDGVIDAAELERLRKAQAAGGNRRGND